MDEQELKEKVMHWHNKGLSQFGIALKLHIKYWEAQRIVEEEIKKDVFQY